jgi:CubicO group peptidase (beta-lactamase class C family)
MMNSVSWYPSAALLFLVTLAVQPAPAAEVTFQKVKAAFPELDKLAEQTLKKTGVPGMSVAVVYKDQVVYLKGFGVRRAGKNGKIRGRSSIRLCRIELRPTFLFGL